MLRWGWTAASARVSRPCNQRLDKTVVLGVLEEAVGSEAVEAAVADVGDTEAVAPGRSMSAKTHTVVPMPRNSG